jgi:hypothetical protein
MFKKSQRVLSDDLSLVDLQKDEIQQLKLELEDYKKKCENMEKELMSEKAKNEKLMEENEKLKEEKPKQEEQKKNGLFSFKKADQDQVKEIQSESGSSTSTGGFSIFKKKVPSISTPSLESTSLDEKKNNGGFFSKFSPRSNNNASTVQNGEDMLDDVEPQKSKFSLFKKKKETSVNNDFDNPFNEEDFSNTTHKKHDNSRDSFGVDFENQSFLK